MKAINIQYILEQKFNIVCIRFIVLNIKQIVWSYFRIPNSKTARIFNIQIPIKSVYNFDECLFTWKKNNDNKNNFSVLYINFLN